MKIDIEAALWEVGKVFLGYLALRFGDFIGTVSAGHAKTRSGAVWYSICATAVVCLIGLTGREDSDEKWSPQAALVFGLIIGLPALRAAFVRPLDQPSPAPAQPDEWS